MIFGIAWLTWRNTERHPDDHKGADIPSYIDEARAHRRTALQKLRNLCLKHLKRFQEGIHYGIPVYKRNGAMEISFAS